MKVNVDAVMDPETSALSWLLEIHVLLYSVSTHIPSGMVLKSFRESPEGQHEIHGIVHQEEKVMVSKSAHLLQFTRKYSLIKCFYQTNPNNPNGKVVCLIYPWYARMVSINPSHSVKISANSHSFH